MILFLLSFCLLVAIFAESNSIESLQSIITNGQRTDGFGSQFQEAISAVIYAELADKNFIYTPFCQMEHNYSNDPDFILKKEWLVNFIGNFDINTSRNLPPAANYRQFVDQNIAKASSSVALKKIKRLFRMNKEGVAERYFTANRFNIAVHVRRPNDHDSRILGTDIPDRLFLDVIVALREIFFSRKPLFHIYSQGEIDKFAQFYADDIVFHLNESIEDTFVSMVFADALVTSPSSFSYVAGLLSEGIVYYVPFWHEPLPHWISVDELLSKKNK